MAVLLAARMALLAWDALRRPSCCFVTYYTAAQLVKNREPLDGLYDRARFSERVREYEPTVYDFFRPNPPPTALIMLPLTGLDYPTARAVWTWGSLVLYIVLVWLIGRAVGLGAISLPAFACVAFLFQSVHQTLRSGQVYVVVLALMALAWHGYRKRRQATLGGSLAVLGTFKVAGVWQLPQLVAERRWSDLVWFFVFAIMIVLATVPIVGPEAWIASAEGIAAVPREFGVSVTAYQSLYGFFQHLFVRVPVYNPEPLLHEPEVARVLWWATAALLIVASMVTAARRPGRDATFAAFILMGVLMMPVSHGTHYTPVLLAIAILLGALRKQGSFFSAAILAAGIVAITADVPYQSPRFASGLVTFLAYPRLYGALLLWGLSLRLAWAEAALEKKQAADRASDIIGRLKREIPSRSDQEELAPFPFR